MQETSTTEINVISQYRHVEMWRELRDRQDKYENGLRIISRWIDRSGEPSQRELLMIHRQCLQDAKSSPYSLVYCEPGDTLKFALVQIGVALAFDRVVIIVGSCDSVTPIITANPNCLTNFETLQQALHFIKKTVF